MENMETNESMETMLEPNSGKKGNKGIIIGVAVLAVLAVIIGCVFLLKPKTDPKEAVSKAFKEYMLAESVSPTEEIFGFQEMNQNFLKEGYEMDMGLTFTESSAPELTAIMGAGFDTSIKYDVPNKAMGMDLGIQYGGMNLIDLMLYLDAAELQVQLPSLSQKVFSINYAEDLQAQMEASPFMGPMLMQSGLDSQTLALLQAELDMLRESMAIEPVSLDIMDIWKRYIETSQAVIGLNEAMTATANGTRTMTLGGTETTVNVYQVVVPKEAFGSFLKGTGQFFMEDQALKDYLDMYFGQLEKVMAMEAQLYGMEDMDSIQEELAELQAGMDEVLNVLEQSAGQLQLNAYVTEDGKLAGFDADTVLMDADESITVETNWVFEGGYAADANWTGKVVLSDGTEEMYMEISRASTYDDTAYADELIFAFSTEEDEYVNLALGGNYTMADKAYEIYMNMAASEEISMDMSMSGTINSFEKGKSVDAEVDALNMTIDDGIEEISFGMAGNMAMRPLTGGVQKSAGEVLDVFKATEAEWGAAIMEIMGSLNAMGMM